MLSEVHVTTDPLVVYGIVGLLMAALVLALIFAWPRRGLGPWTPGGDIFGHEPTPPIPSVPTNPSDPWTTIDQAERVPRGDRR
jgi:hypothetical protein